MSGWLIFEIAVNIYQSLLMVYYVRRRFHLVKPQIQYAILPCIAIARSLSIYLFIDVPFLDTFVFCFPLIYTWFVSDDKWYYKLFWNAVLATVFIGLTNGTINLFSLFSGTSWDYIMAETSLRVVFIVFLNILLFVGISIILRIGRNSNDILSWLPSGVFPLMLIINLATIEILYVIRAQQNTTVSSENITIASFLLLFLAVLSLGLYKSMSISTFRQKKTEAELRQAKLLQDHYKEIKEIYSYMATFEHDLKHQLNLIQALIAHNETEKAKEYYTQFFSTQRHQFCFKTGNVAADALLTVKRLLMDKYNIRFTYQPYPLQKLPIEESDFCLILSNILDNAIEACVQIEEASVEKEIMLKFARSWNLFLITCINTTDASKIKRNGHRFLTSKKGNSGHGFGITSVQRIVSSSNGQCSFNSENNTFVVEVALPFQE